nr:unnamed protein product [Callosobruchus chinensis]
MDTENDSSTTDSPNADSDDKDFNIRDLASSSDDTSVESEYFESFPDIPPKECNISSTSLAESLKLQVRLLYYFTRCDEKHIFLDYQYEKRSLFCNVLLEENDVKYADVDPNLKNFKRPCQHDSKALNCKKVSLQYIRQHRGKFFEVPSKILQNQKLCRYMSVLPPVRKRSREMDSQKPKTFSVYYYFPCGKETFRVCRSFLSAVFNVKKGRLRSVARTLSLGNVPKETRGGRRLSNINETKKQNVRDFLNRLPACESHYNRQKSKRVYLAADLNIATLHRMYNTESQSDLHVTLSMFKRLFYSEFNIGFSSPASDVCGTCLNLKNAIKKDIEDRLKTELKRGKRDNNFRVKKVPLGNDISEEKKENVKYLLDAQFNKDNVCWEREPQFEFYKKVFGLPSVEPEEDEDQEQCDCLEPERALHV